MWITRDETRLATTKVNDDSTQARPEHGTVTHRVVDVARGDGPMDNNDSGGGTNRTATITLTSGLLIDQMALYAASAVRAYRDAVRDAADGLDITVEHHLDLQVLLRLAAAPELLVGWRIDRGWYYARSKPVKPLTLTARPLSTSRRSPRSTDSCAGRHRPLAACPRRRTPTKHLTAPRHGGDHAGTGSGIAAHALLLARTAMGCPRCSPSPRHLRKPTLGRAGPMLMHGQHLVSLPQGHARCARSAEAQAVEPCPAL